MRLPSRGKAVEGRLVAVADDPAAGVAGQTPEIDGIFAAVDAFATGTMRALRDEARAVPGQVRVVTRYDGLRAREERPALTAVDLHLDQVAAVATRMLMDLIAGNPIPQMTEGPPPSLICRGSSQGGQDAR